jgi:hypothetical protein
MKADETLTPEERPPAPTPDHCEHGADYYTFQNGLGWCSKCGFVYFQDID